MNLKIFVILSTLCTAASAATITTLFNTGVDSSGNALASNGAIDTHYMLVYTPATSVLASAVTYFNPAYFANTSISDWISVNANGFDSPSGMYDFRTTFTIAAGFNPSTASITGRFAVDNGLTGVRLNSTTTTFSPAIGGFGAWTPLTISSGFVVGLNNLDFFVQDDGAPMALRLELTGTVLPLAATPEPASALLIAVPFALVGFLKRRTLLKR